MTTLVHSLRIFDGHSLISTTGSILISAHTGLILSLSPLTPSPLPEADIVVDGSGHTLLPGLIDAHVHVHKGESELRQCLKFGVTTVLDMFNEPEWAGQMKRLVGERSDLADFRSACHAATVEGGWPAPVIMAIAADKEKAAKQIKSWPKLKDPEDAEPFILSNIKHGADYIKLMQESCTTIFGSPIPVPSPALQAAIVQAAHKHNLITLGHAFSQNETLLLLTAGIDGLAHCFCDESPSQELIEAYKKNNSFLIPTIVCAASVTGEEKEDSERWEGHEMVEKAGVSSEDKGCFCDRAMLAAKGKECSVERCYEVVRALKREGLDIVAGTDTATGLQGTAFGMSLHQELSLYVSRCGFSPLEALRSATSVTARRFNLKDRGELREGLRADVLMVKGDPTVDIRCTMDIVGVWRGGKGGVVPS